jgi:hypothetical protein
MPAATGAAHGGSVRTPMSACTRAARIMERSHRRVAPSVARREGHSGADHPLLFVLVDDEPDVSEVIQRAEPDPHDSSNKPANANDAPEHVLR